MTFVAARLTSARPPINGPNGRALETAQGSAQDDEVALLRFGALQRSAYRVDPAALQDLGSSYGIGRYAADTDVTYQARLEGAWVTRELAGADGSLLQQLEAFGLPDVAIFRDADGQFGPGAPGAYYSEFWVFLGPNFGSTGIAPLVLGSFVLGAQTTLGSTASRAQIIAIKKIILRWKATHGYPVRIFLAFVGPPGLPWRGAPAGPLLGIGFLGGVTPLILGAFQLSGGNTANTGTVITSWVMGKTLGDTVGGLGGFTLGGYVI